MKKERVLTDEEYKLIESLFKMTDKQLYKVMTKFLIARYSEEQVLVNENFIIARGESPIAIVAHLDTVYKYPVSDLYYDTRKNVLWSPDGLGADDRAGVFAIIKLIQNNLRPSVILTMGEEIGGVGAAALASIPCPIDNLKYIIELDRQGKDDAVFYSTGNEDFQDYIIGFGFTKRRGTFSDISFLAPGWEKCAVNLSIGYENEHSVIETLNVTHMFDTIRKVIKMLKVKDIPFFEYIDDIRYFSIFKPSESATKSHCECCGHQTVSYEMLPVKIGKNKKAMYCVDCLSKVDWCAQCQEPFISTTNSLVCEECKR